MILQDKNNKKQIAKLSAFYFTYSMMFEHLTVPAVPCLYPVDLHFVPGTIPFGSSDHKFVFDAEKSL
jgi:hypothetical protein